MNPATDIKRLDQRPIQEALLSKNKRRFLGTDLDGVMRTIFTGNAWMAFVILGLITFSLFKEGLGFFPQHMDSLRTYRQAGLEYVDIVRDQHTAHGTLLRYLQKTRQNYAAALAVQSVGESAAAERLAPLDQLTRAFDEAVIPLDEVLSEMTRTAADIKDRHTISRDAVLERQIYLDAGMKEEAEAVVIEDVDFKAEIATVKAFYPRYQEVNRQFAAELQRIQSSLPVLSDEEVSTALTKFKAAVEKYVAGFPEVDARLQAWDQDKPYSWIETFTRFVFGPKWVTQSFWQDWYGFVPLFMGSLCISFTALLVAVPFGVGAAIYINQLASPAETNFIKPYIEFISAIPSVVLGFFGIAVLGETIRWVTQQEWLAWVPFFPISERLNIMTAGLLLGLMAVPTIFTLSEDAINNVPRAFKEASFALGANRLQTIVRIIVPAALSGIISAVLLGFGRVIGETMVVLMCAGNRIEIPDFTQGLGALFMPVHTMTGIIAQEIPEVPKGVLQYRALFMLAIMLFFISLVINYLAQLIVKKYRISIG